MTAAVGIDPRIQARRTEVRRVEGHRRLRRLRAVVAVLGAFGVAFALTRSPAMDVDHVRIEADGLDPGMVREAAGLRPGEPMTDVDTQAVADTVAALPLVGSAEVRRSWPNAVTVDVTAVHPGVAIAATGGGWLVTDGSGGVISTVASRPVELVAVGEVELSSAPGQIVPERVRPAAAVGAALPTDLRERVAQVVVAEDGGVEVALTDGGLVVFASDGDYRAAAEAAAAVAATVPPGCIEVIDVTSPVAPALRRAEDC